MADEQNKKNILFLVGCEPQLAYRIRIEAESLARAGHKVVLRGIRFFADSPAHEERDGYEEHRTMPPPFFLGFLATTKYFVTACIKQGKLLSLLGFMLLASLATIIAIPIIALLLPVIFFTSIIPKIGAKLSFYFKRGTVWLVKVVRYVKRQSLRALHVCVSFLIRALNRIRNVIDRVINKLFDAIADGLLWIHAKETDTSRAIARSYKKTISPLNSWFRGLSIIRLLALLKVITRRSCAHFNDWKSEGVKPDIIYVKDLDTLPAAVAIQKFTKAPIMYGCYEFYPHSIPGFPRWAVSALMRLEKWMIHSVSNAVTVTPQMQQAIEEAYPTMKDKVIWIPNVDPVPELSAGESDAMMKELIAGRRSFMYQGNFADERGIEELLEAWRHIDANKAVLIIRGPDNVFSQKYKAMASEYGVLDKGVVFLPPLTNPKETIQESINAARQVDICLIPYLPVTLNNKNCCPRKLSHYMFAGRMIVCTQLDFVRGVIEEADCGLAYDHRNIDNMIKVINRCIDDEEMVKKCQQNAFAYATEHYNWSHYEPLFLKQVVGA